jgi:DNA-3-methyladenine glycosylase II
MKPIIDATGKLPLPTKKDQTVAVSLVHIVAGQMLSGSVAQTIIGRMAKAVEHKGIEQLYHLSDDDLRACGLSGRKAKTIAAVRDLAESENERLEAWRELTWPD